MERTKPPQESDSLVALQRRLEEFNAARGWLRFHTPKKLAEALAVEAAELLECLLWQEDLAAQDLDADSRERVESELADIFIYALNLANALDVEAGRVIARKLQSNAERFPATPEEN